MGLLKLLLIPFGLLATASLCSASYLEYKVDAQFHGRPSFKIQGSTGASAQKLVDERMKKGFSGSIKVKVYSSDTYTELPSILPDWGKLRPAAKLNSWDGDSFFAVRSGKASLGDMTTLARFIPLGQRLLLAGERPPEESYKDLVQRASKKGGHSPVCVQEGIKEIVWLQDRLQEDMVAPGARIKLAEYRLVNEESLEVKRFHPSGRLLNTETWTPIRELSSSPPPEPLCESWQVGSWVLDLRDPSQPMHKKWEGCGREPSSADSKPIKGTTFRLTWLAPGLAMMIGGAAFLAYFTFRRKPPAKD